VHDGGGGETTESERHPNPTTLTLTLIWWRSDTIVLPQDLDRADIGSEKEIVFIKNEARVTGRVGCVKFILASYFD